MNHALCMLYILFFFLKDLARFLGITQELFSMSNVFAINIFVVYTACLTHDDISASTEPGGGGKGNRDRDAAASHRMGIAARSQAGGEEMVCSNGLGDSLKVEFIRNLSPVSPVLPMCNISNCADFYWEHTKTVKLDIKMHWISREVICLLWPKQKLPLHLK